MKEGSWGTRCVPLLPPAWGTRCVPLGMYIA